MRMAIADVVEWVGRVGVGSKQAEYDRCIEPSVDFDELALNGAQSGANCFTLIISSWGKRVCVQYSALTPKD